MSCHYHKNCWHTLTMLSVTTYSTWSQCLFVQARPPATAPSCTAHTQEQKRDRVLCSQYTEGVT
eukprot:COSAG01_NODE_14824_length_1405_cov_10.766462_1_plen_63_part_10